MNPRIAHPALLLLAASAFASGPAIARFEDDGCRIAFDHPPAMSVHRVSGPAPIGTLTGPTPSAGIAESWNLAPCRSTEVDKRQRYVESLRDAKPTAAAYVPHPFPASNDQIVADFVHQFRRLRSAGQPARITPDDARLLRLIEADQLGAQVIRIANWRGTRCLASRDGEEKFLLRLTDTSTAREIARAWLEDSGLLGVIAYRDPNVDPSWWEIPIPSLEETADEVGAIAGHELVDAEYVTTFGQFQCDALLPCVAVRSPLTGTAYVVNDRGAIVAIPTRARRLSRSRHLATLSDISTVSKKLASNQTLISLGGDAYAIADRIR